MKNSVKRFAVHTALLLTALTAAAQEAKFGEKVDVNVVLLDTIVTDSRGNQILGLGKDDFVVTENGVQKTVDSVDYFTTRQLVSSREQDAPFKVDRVREERYTVFFFDKPEGGALWDQLALARRSALRFVNEKMTPADRVAIVGHDVRLKVFSDFTNDKNQLAKAIGEVAKFGNGVTDARGEATASILRNIDRDAMIGHTGTVYEGLDVLADALRPIGARKTLVLFSPGIHEPGEDVRNGIVLNTSRYYEPMANSLNAANVAVYAINIQRNPGSAPAVHQTLERIAADTNGSYYRYLATFDPALDQIDRANAGYYLLTYRTQKQQGQAGFQKVKVALRNPEFKVQSRPGYLVQ